MNIKELNNKGLDREWLVTIPKEIITNKLDEKYVQISRTAKLPGFRPGKVPLSFVKSKYEVDVKAKVTEKLISIK